jgi:hypothetical protein
MACDVDAPGLPEGAVFCGWADASTLGQVTVVAAGADVDLAAQLTRDFRADITHR